MRTWLLRWWRRLIEAGAFPIEARLSARAAQRAERLERMVMGLADLSANREAAITSVIQHQARTLAAHGELLARLADRLGAVLDNQETTVATLAQLDQRLMHLAIQLTGKSATEVARERGARPPREFDFEHRQ